MSAVAMLGVAGDVFSGGVRASTTIGRAPSTGAEVNACGLAAELPSPSKEPSHCC